MSYSDALPGSKAAAVSLEVALVAIPCVLPQTWSPLCSSLTVRVAIGFDILYACCHSIANTSSGDISLVEIVNFEAGRHMR